MLRSDFYLRNGQPLSQIQIQAIPATVPLKVGDFSYNHEATLSLQSARANFSYDNQFPIAI